MKNIFHTPEHLSNPFRRLLAIAVTLVMVAFVLMFAMVAFVVILVLGASVWCYLWWKTRHLRKQMRSSRGSKMESELSRGAVIEGEVIRVVDHQVPSKR